MSHLDALPYFADPDPSEPSGGHPPAPAAPQPGAHGAPAPGAPPAADPDRSGRTRDLLARPPAQPGGRRRARRAMAAADPLLPAQPAVPPTSTWTGPAGRDLSAGSRPGLLDGRTDWALVRALRTKAADRLANAIRQRPGLSEGDQQELGRAMILELVGEHELANIGSGVTMTVDERDGLAAAIHDALFGLGRLQPLVDSPTIENIEVNGWDTVHLLHADGQVEAGPPVADSDDELLETVAFIASRHERLFSPAHPQLDLRLPDGSRLAASGFGITPRPLVVIRRHRLSRIDLDALVVLGTVPAELAAFLREAVVTRRSIVISGPQGGGKTTLARALAGCIPRTESIGTIETEFELHLHDNPERHPRVRAWEARSGSSELGSDGRRVGAIDLDRLLHSSLRYNLDRVIVGEVRGPEVLPMFKAMQAGAGSLSTTHAHSARAAIERLVTCGMEAGAHVTEQFAYRQIAAHIDLIAQIGFVPVAPGAPGGTPGRRRVVTEVVAVEPGEAGRPALTDVYRYDVAEGRGQLFTPDRWAPGPSGLGPGGLGPGGLGPVALGPAPRG